MDGTLLDTAIATSKAFETVKEKHSLSKLPIEKIHEAMGLHGLEFHGFLFPDKSIDELGAIANDIDVIEDEMITEIGKDILFPGVSDMLKNLHEKGVAMYIASTGSKSHVNTSLTACGIKDYFSVISCDEPKKDEMVKKLIGNSDKALWAMVGDMFKDSEAAISNGILALGAGFGYLAKDEYSLFDEILKTPADILDYV